MKKKLLFLMSALVLVAGVSLAISHKGTVKTATVLKAWDFTTMSDADTLGYVQAESNVINTWNSDPDSWGAIYDYDDALVDEAIMINAETEFAPTKGLTFTTNAGQKQVLFRNYPLNYGGTHMYANKQIKVKVPVAEGAKGLMLMTGTTKAGKVITATGVEETLGLISYQAAKSDDITYGPMLFTLTEGTTEVELTIPSPIYVQSIQFIDSIAPREAAEASFAAATVKAEVGKKFRNELTTYSGATVTFTSSNTEVATINETGAVTPVAPGRTTMTATIYATDTHKEAIATYDVIVAGSEPWDFTLMSDLDLEGFVDEESNVVNSWSTNPNDWGALYDKDAPLNDDPIMINAEKEFEPTKGLTFTTNAGQKQILFRNYPLNYGGVHMYANKQITVKVPVKEGAKSLMLMTGTTKAGKVIKATGVEETLGLISYQAAKSDDITYGPMFFTLTEGTTEVEVTIPSPLYIQKIQFTDSVVPREATEASFAAPTVKAEVGKKFRNELTTYAGATVTYTSSNTEVATINETGAVTPVAPGRATMTATIYATDTHKEAVATYDVIVLGGEPWDFTLMCELDTLGYVKDESNVINTWSSNPDAWGALYDYDDALIDEPIMLNAETEFSPTKGLTFTTNAGQKQILFRNYPLNYGGAHMYANKQIKVKVPVKEGAKGLMLMTGTTKAGKIISATGVEETLGLVSYQAAKSDDITYGPMLFTVAEGATEVELTIPSPLYIQKIQFTDSVAPREAAEASFAAPTVKAEVGKKFRNELTTYSGATVTYTSSNTEVATINETGAVTPVAPGRATMTATIYATDTHKQAQATYDVIVLGGEPWDFTLMCELDTLGYVKEESNVVNTWSSNPDAWGALYDNEAPLNDDPIMLNATTEFGPTKGLTFTTNAGQKQILFRNYPLNYGGAHMYANKQITVKVPVPEGAKSLMLMTGTTKAGKIISATGVEETLGLVSYQAAKSDDITYGAMIFTVAAGATEIELTIPSPLYIQKIQFVDSIVPREAITAEFAQATYQAEVGKKFRNTLTVSDPSAVVTYTSSNTEVATINETGAVTPLAPGTTTITATIYANDTHKQAQVSYELTVVADPTGINDLKDSKSKKGIYDLTGRKVLNPQAGRIYIINGAKHMYKK